MAAGRVAGRYVICVGDVAAALSVITLVANCEATYRAGSAMGFWNILTLPLGMTLALTGYCTYRWRASWFGNDTSNSGRTPHEQKMAGVLGTWRGGFAFTMIGLTALLVITVMNHEAFLFPGAHGRFSSRETRIALLNKIADETVPDASVRADIAAALEAVPPALLNEPLSQLRNNDTPYIDAARIVLNGNIPPRLREEAEAVGRGERAPSPELAAIQGENARQAQMVRTLYGQMMLPVTLRQILPTGVIGLFALLMLMLLVSTDDSRIFNASSTWVQDVILPFMKKPPDSRTHIAMLRWSSVSVAVFFLVVAVFFSQLDYINMFTQIMCAIWLGGGGTVMVFGLYSRFGNIVGAWCSIVFGSGFSLAGLVLQRTWSAHVIPVLARHGWTEGVFRFFAKLAAPLNPWVDWSFGYNSGESTQEQALQLFREKFFMNSTEIYGISMVLSIVAYCIGSYIALKAGWCRLYDLDKLLHRGRYAEMTGAAKLRNDDALRANNNGALRQMTNCAHSVIAAKDRTSLRPKTARNSSILRFVSRIVGIDDEYTFGDKIIAWSVFAYSVCWQFGVAFVGVFLWNAVSPWPKAWWGRYYYITSLIIPMVVGGISTVWFIWGGIRDGIRLFRDLDARVADASDNGFVDRSSR